MALVVKDRASGAIIAAADENDGVIICEGSWYFDLHAVDMRHLRVTQRTYTCPYKGVCYWIDLESPSFRAQNVGWVYRNPKPGWEMIQDRIGLYARNTVGTLAEHVVEV